jgi:hypothetical protein
LSDQTAFLYQDGRRSWYAAKPGVTRLAQDRAAQQRDDEVLEEIRRRLKEEARTRGDFSRVYACVAHGEIADEDDTRLVIIDPANFHSAKNLESAAIKAAAECLNNRGTSPRLKRNTLIFLASDRARLDDLKKAVRDYLAWQSIEDDSKSLNLDEFQRNQAQTKHRDADATVNQRIPEAYMWLLVPSEKKPGDQEAKGLEWTELKPTGQEALAVKASKRLKNDGLLITKWAGVPLRMELDRVPLWRGNHVSVKQLADDFARYLYLPRLRDSNVLVEAIAEGPSLISWKQDSFAYAEGWDEQNQRYRGLQAGQRVRVSVEGGLVVQPETAAPQLAEEKRRAEEEKDPRDGKGSKAEGEQEERRDGGRQPEPEPPRARRFHGSVTLNPVRLSRDASDMANEIVQYLVKQPGAKVEVTLEIQAEIPNGAPDDLIRTVSENCRTLKFSTFDFEES